MQQWIASTDADGLPVVYEAGGSSKGRLDFARRSVDYAVTEIPYRGVDETGAADTSDGRAFAYVPIAGGATALTYHLEVEGKLYRGLRLSGPTIAGIFTGTIKFWSDPAIERDNAGIRLPRVAIRPVVRSDGAGITWNFTSWLAHEFPTRWQQYAGQAGATAYYPRTGNMIGAAGSDQTMNQVSAVSGNGTIAYVESEYPVWKEADHQAYPVAKVLNRSGRFVAPNGLNVTRALARAAVNADQSSPSYGTTDLRGVWSAGDAAAYPLSWVGYLIVPTGADDARMTTAKRQTLVDFASFALCDGQAASAPFGDAALPVSLQRFGLTQVARVAAGDSAVDLAKTDPASCSRHDQAAAAVPACDAYAAGPCERGARPDALTRWARPGSPWHFGNRRQVLPQDLPVHIDRTSAHRAAAYVRIENDSTTDGIALRAGWVRTEGIAVRWYRDGVDVTRQLRAGSLRPTVGAGKAVVLKVVLRWTDGALTAPGSRVTVWLRGTAADPVLPRYDVNRIVLQRD